MDLNSINEVILAYETDMIDTATVLQILEEQPTAIAIWVGDNGYDYSKDQTVNGLENYSRYLKSGAEYPFFFPYLSEDAPDTFCFNDALSNGKAL